MLEQSLAQPSSLGPSYAVINSLNDRGHTCISSPLPRHSITASENRKYYHVLRKSVTSGTFSEAKLYILYQTEEENQEKCAQNLSPKSFGDSLQSWYAIREAVARNFPTLYEIWCLIELSHIVKEKQNPSGCFYNIWQLRGRSL